MEKEIYGYGSLKRELKEINSTIFPIGKTHLDRDIFCIKWGTGTNEILYAGAFHGMEWLTSAILVRFIKYLENNSATEDIKNLSEKIILYCIPMVNPDGVEINRFREGWQANARGVDLNHNFDAGFEKSRAFELVHGITGPGKTRYAGIYPFSEMETKTVSNFVKSHNFKTVFAFHSQGMEVYYDYENLEPPYSATVAKLITENTAYKVSKPSGFASFGGFKDWFIKEYRRMGFTVEIGIGKNPLPLSDLEKVWDETLPLLTNGLKTALI